MDSNGDIYDIPSTYINSPETLNWNCELKSYKLSISSKASTSFSNCSNEGNICNRKNCIHSIDREIPKATDEQTLHLFKERVNQNKNYIEVRDEDIVESLDIVAMGESSHLIENKFQINWNLTKNCNYDCSYCPPRLHDQYSPYNEVEDLLDSVKLHDNIPPSKHIEFNISGGEPLLYPDMIEVLTYLKDNYNPKIRMNTNGSVGVLKLLRFHKYGEIIISVHHEFVQEKHYHSWREFIKNTPFTDNQIIFKIFKEHRNDIDINLLIDLQTRYKFVNVIDTEIIMDI